jgi:hypothetical protein
MRRLVAVLGRYPVASAAILMVLIAVAIVLGLPPSASAAECGYCGHQCIPPGGSGCYWPGSTYCFIYDPNPPPGHQGGRLLYCYNWDPGYYNCPIWQDIGACG